MVDLAKHNGAAPVSRRDIAQRQDISSDYVAQLFRPLQEAGLVEGIKGPGGGYRLALDPDQIRVRDVVEAVEGPVALAPCLGRQASPCPRAAGCATRELWEQLSTKIRDVLDSYTLKGLSSEAEALG